MLLLSPAGQYKFVGFVELYLNISILFYITLFFYNISERNLVLLSPLY